MRESFPLKGSLLRSPKQPVLARDRDWYPYYAAFTEGFVSSVIESYLSDATLVLDPWNGSGTTTSVCAQKGISSIGIDINPALTVIAKARLKVGECYESLGELCNRIISEITKRNKNEQPDDLLLHWMRPSSVSHIRAIQSAIHQCNTNGMDNCYSLDAITRANSFDNTCCFSYCALFMSVRKLLQRFTTTNPTWFKEPATIAQRIAPSEELCLKVFVESFDRLRNLISKSRVSSSNARFLTQDSQRLPFGDGEIDGVITSPPYATRIDYVKGVLPELAVLGADRGFLTKLRQDSLGTPVVRGYNQKLPSNLSSKYGIETLKHIRDHSSKGSPSYYFPWINKYFFNLEESIKEIARVVRSDGYICIVVRDSYYKEFLIDLQQIVTEIMQNLNRKLEKRKDYGISPQSPSVKQTKENENFRLPKESLLIFR